MNKAELVTAVSEKTGDTKKDVDKAVSAIIESIMESLGNGEKVQIIGFGTFAVRERQGRQGRNPATGEAIQIPAAKVPAFKAGKTLKDSLK